MLTRQRIVTFGIPTLATATIVAAALLTTGTKKLVSTPEPMTPVNVIPSFSGGDGHQIDVVFAVDTTGSMGGLLDGAKQTVWSIASHIKQVDPNANIRIGLVAYKDVGDEYITKPFKLTNDLDAMYAELMSYTAAGGGDTPENVDAALNDALHTMAWRSGAKKMVFVVGDAPPASRGDVPTYDVLAQQAAAQGITINTIRCGWDTQTQMTFSRIAELGGGEFSTIQQDGGVQRVATPYDDRLEKIQAEIDGTNVIYGGDDVRARYEAKMATGAAAAPAAKADRAGYYAKGGYKVADDLVGGYEEGSVAIESVDPAALPEGMRGKDTEAIKAELDSRVAKRKALQGQAAEIAKQREDYLKNNKPTDDDGFDNKVKATVERQLKK